MKQGFCFASFFFKQKKRKILKITHKDMTRFNILMKDAVKMVEWTLQMVWVVK